MRNAIVTICLLVVSLSVISGLSSVNSVEIECLGWFFCDTESVSTITIDATSAEIDTVNLLIQSERYDVVSGYSGASAISADRSIYFVVLSNSTMVNLYVQNQGKVKIVKVASSGGILDNIQYDETTKNLVGNIGNNLVTIDITTGAVGPVTKIWSDSVLTSSKLSSFVNGVYSLIVYSSANSNACYYYYSVDLKTKQITVSTCFPQFTGGSIGNGAYEPLYIYQTGADLFLRLGTNTLGGDISIINAKTGNVTKNILSFLDFAGLDWTLDSGNTGTVAYDPKTGIMYLQAEDSNNKLVMGSADMNNYDNTKTLPLTGETNLNYWQ